MYPRRDTGADGAPANPRLTSWSLSAFPKMLPDHPWPDPRPRPPPVEDGPPAGMWGLAGTALGSPNDTLSCRTAEKDCVRERVIASCVGSRPNGDHERACEVMESAPTPMCPRSDHTKLDLHGFQIPLSPSPPGNQRGETEAGGKSRSHTGHCLRKAPRWIC